MAGRSGVVVVFCLFLYLFVLCFGEPAEDTSTKEYSRIRQLSADQYGRQYGVGHDSSGRRPLPPPTAGRPLFAWNEMGLMSSDKSPPSSGLSAEARMALETALGHTNRRRNKLKSKTVRRVDPSVGPPNKIKPSAKSVRLLRKSLDNGDEEDRGEAEEDEEEEEEDGEVEKGEEDELEKEEDGQEEDEEGGEEEDEEEDDEENGQSENEDENSNDPEDNSTAREESVDDREEANQRTSATTPVKTTVTTTTTTTTTPPLNRKSFEKTDGQDFIDRVKASTTGSSESVDNQDREDIETTQEPSGASPPGSDGVDREREDKKGDVENVSTDPDERATVEVAERSNQIEQDGRSGMPSSEEHDDYAIRSRTGFVGNIRSEVNHVESLIKEDGEVEKEADEDVRGGGGGRSDERNRGLDTDDNIRIPHGQSSATSTRSSIENLTENDNQHGSRVDWPNLTGIGRLSSTHEGQKAKNETFQTSDANHQSAHPNEANEIGTQVQSVEDKIKSVLSAVSSRTSPVSSETVDQDDDETNDIHVHKSVGNGVEVSEELGIGATHASQTNDAGFHPSGTNPNKALNEAVVSATVTDGAYAIGASSSSSSTAGSGDQDETNHIGSDLSKSQPIEIFNLSSSGDDDEQDAVNNEIETFVHPYHSRFLHGQTDLDASRLDTSCTASTPLPVIANAVVAKYGSWRWPSPPFNLLAEVLFECVGHNYQLDPALPDRLFCSNQQWIGQHPRCVAIHHQQQPHFALTETSREDKIDQPEDPAASSGNSTTTAGLTNERACSSEDRGGCEHVCSQSAEPDSIRCSCYRGFRLDTDGKSCVDVDECAVANGGCDGSCTNRPGSFLCSCPLGFRLASNGKKCIDVNECSLRNGHGPCQDVCHNTHGSYRCSCDDMTGTQLAVDGHSCEDIDECRTDNGGCSHSCLNTLGTAFCACPEGYMLADDWKTCEDIDECDYDPGDDQDRLCPGMCRNTIGSYVCVDPDEEPITCQPGYQLHDEDALCLDVDECLSSNGGCSHSCINTDGSHYCLCPAGLFMETDNRTCIDIDECASGNGGCSHTCLNVASSYRCTCPDGYTLDEDWKTCLDIDECNESNTCGVGTCVNLAGSHRCVCPAGYEETSNGCVDMDECLIDPCGSGECFNTEGSFTCNCHSGFFFDNQTCQDVNECADGNPCFDGLCENTVGSFTCSCQPGYYLENNTCFDVDECVNSPCIDGTCVNEPGSYLCICEPGFTLERNVCIDFDECLISPCANGTCVNQIGSFRCDCPDGYISHNNSCLDVNECDSSPCVNGHCVNTGGSYLCRCLDGYKALGNICLDIDECETGPCVNGECVNTQGSYECECLPGYYLEEDACLDVDECQANPCVNGTCVNLLGSYQCECPVGYLLVDSRICLDINECSINNGNCDQTCTNTPGSYFCSCSEGFYLNPEDKRQCLDVDECALHNGGCSQVCLNRPGNFTCECRTGYILSTDKVSCLEVAPAVTHYCPVIEPPPGGYLHCSSRPSADGYKPGTTCTLRCRKGYAYRRHKPQLIWQANQVLENPVTIVDKTTVLLPPSRSSTSGLAMLQGWKATQIRPVDQSWQFGSRNNSEDSQKKLKEKNIRKSENDKRQLMVGLTNHQQPVLQGLRGRGRNRSSVARIKRQQQQQQAGRRALQDQPFRRCGDDGKWKGKLGFCQALTCPPLTKPTNGSVSPLSCSTGDAAPNQHCYFTCDPGFRVTGNPPVRTCLPSLKWNPLRPPPACEKASDTSNKHINRQRNNTIEVTVHTATTTEAPTAGAAIHEMPPQLGSNSQSAVVKPGHSKWSYLDGLDLLFHMPSDLTHYQPHMTNNFVHFNPVHPWPRIECPKDMTIDLPPGQRTVEVFIPQPATNVDYLSNVEAEPNWAKQLRAELGPSRMVISFRARNPVTEYTAICSFVLEVRDREAPTVKNCPHDVHVRLSSLEPYANAPWIEPSFTDNIAVTHVIKSKEPNALFPLGEHVVSYTASDAAGNNARCQFTVNVSPALVPAEMNRSESCARLESPPNGDLNCLSWTWGQMCRPSCSAGHVFFRPLPSAVYLCGRDRRWKPGTSVPDCAPTSVLPEGGCAIGWEERRSGGKQCVGCAPGLHRPSNSTVCIPCPMGTYQDNFSAGNCKSCPKKLTTCFMGARQCTDCKPPEECSAPVQRIPGADTAQSSKLATPARRKHLQRIRQQQNRQRQNATTTSSNTRRRV